MKDFFWVSKKSEIPQGLPPVSLTIGNFDGVHLGHQELLKASVNWAKENQGTSIVLTFHPHPNEVLNPQRSHSRIFDLEDQKIQFKKWGVGGVFLQSFTREFSELSAHDFLNQFLLQTFKPSQIVVGHDFSFGHGRMGTVKELKEFCILNKINYVEVPPFFVHQKRVSTSAIREALMNADLANVRAFLGRNYYLKGIVEKGEGRGRQIGFATANIRPFADFFPKTGVYITKTYHKDQIYSSVTNIGLNKTFISGEHRPIKVETHIFDFQGDIYGEVIRVELFEYLREEKKFPSVEALVEQIQLDVAEAKRRNH